MTVVNGVDHVGGKGLKTAAYRQSAVVLVRRCRVSLSVTPLYTTLPFYLE